MEDIKSIVSKNITNLRLSKGMTQLELANKLNYSDKAVSKWERGESLPELNTLIAIADFFQVSLDFLIKGEKTPVDIKIEKKKTNYSVLAAICFFGIWFVSLFTFIFCNTVFDSFENSWIIFILTIPISLLLWLVLNTLWFNKKLNYLIISLLIWSILLSIHLSLIIFKINFWQLYLLGIPAQIIIILCSKLHNK